jgi:DNA polymerase-3 subunit gamma/tau
MESSTKQDSAASPFPATTARATIYATTITEGALAVAPQVAVEAVTPPSIEQIRHAVGSALVEGGHVSAAQLLGAGKWTLDGASLRIEVTSMGKKMLALTVNAAAEKIIRQELQRLGAPTRFLVVPGEGTAQAASMPAPTVGSIQEAALANPLVQKAKEIFKAEVRSVVDLRQK